MHDARAHFFFAISTPLRRTCSALSLWTLTSSSTTIDVELLDPVNKTYIETHHITSRINKQKTTHKKRKKQLIFYFWACDRISLCSGVYCIITINQSMASWQSQRLHWSSCSSWCCMRSFQQKWSSWPSFESWICSFARRTLDSLWLDRSLELPKR